MAASRTRYFVIVSLLILTVGLGTGLVAYYVGFPLGAASATPDELKLVPADAALVAYADVRAIMVSEVRQRLLQVLPFPATGQQEFQNQTGINIDTDVDRLIACLMPPGPVQPGAPAGMAIVRGRFNDTKIESLLRSHGAQVEDYKGTRLLVADVRSGQPNQASLSLAFLEPGLIAVGSSAVIHAAVDRQGGSGDSATSNDELMGFVKARSGDNAWAVGRFDALTAEAKLPAGVATQLPPITWFSAGGRVDSGISGTFQADARDEQAAASLRDMLRGIVAFARLQTASRPELSSMLDTLRLGGEGKSVTLAFDLSPQMFDQLATALKAFHTSPPAPGK